jgi:hypothetical protein
MAGDARRTVAAPVPHPRARLSERPSQADSQVFNDGRPCAHHHCRVAVTALRRTPRIELPVWALAAALAAGWLAFAPPTPDLAAQVYRAGLFEREGFAVFHLSWYGGHHLPAYSLLSPPLAALVGPRLLGAAAVIASVALFERLLRPHVGTRAARIATVWFALAATGDLLIGRITFSLGVTVGLAALLALQRGRTALGGALAVGCAAASPVAGVFLALAGTALAVGSRSRGGLVLAVAALATVLLLAAAFPEGGTQPYGLAHAAIPVALAAGLLWMFPRAHPALIAGVAMYAGACLAASLLSTPLGSNVTRLGVLFGGPLLAALVVTHRIPSRRWGPVVALAGVLAVWVSIGPVREVAKGAGDPSTTPEYHRPVVDALAHAVGRARIEVPFTRGHWEAAYIAPKLPLARGWETQLDVKHGAFFYRTEKPYSAATYHRWLRENAVSYVAVPDAAPDPSSRHERRLIASGLPFLVPFAQLRHWRIYRVADPLPLVSAPGSLVTLDATGVTLRARGPAPILVRVRHTPYFTVTRGSACITRAADGWTRVIPVRPGVIRIDARFAPGRRFSTGITCGRAP